MRSSSGGTAREGAVAAFEREHGLRFPTHYRDFLVRHDGRRLKVDAWEWEFAAAPGTSPRGALTFETPYNLGGKSVPFFRAFALVSERLAATGHENGLRVEYVEPPLKPFTFSHARFRKAVCIARADGVLLMLDPADPYSLWLYCLRPPQLIRRPAFGKWLREGRQFARDVEREQAAEAKRPARSRPKPGALRAATERLARAAPFKLPKEYLALLRTHDGSSDYRHGGVQWTIATADALRKRLPLGRTKRPYHDVPARSRRCSGRIHGSSPTAASPAAQLGHPVRAPRARLRFRGGRRRLPLLRPRRRQQRLGASPRRRRRRARRPHLRRLVGQGARGAVEVRWRRSG